MTDLNKWDKYYLNEKLPPWENGFSSSHLA